MAEEKAKIKLTASQIIKDLESGLDRKAIRAKYGLSATDAKRLFNEEPLRRVRVKAPPAFDFEDDVTAKDAVKSAIVKETKPKAVKVANTEPQAVEEAPKAAAKAAPIDSQ